MAEAALHFSDITFAFDKGKPLFESLSVCLSNEAGSGKIIALMGPSGVGKTTFCDLALGIRRPQKGLISFDPDNANVAFIPQKGVIFDELSIKENISCLKYSRTVGKTFHEDKVQQAIEALALSQVVLNNSPPSTLSGGEAQRVMLARIQTINCDVLILDEPCSFLDNRVKDSFLGALRSTVDEYCLLALMVTHVWDEARLVADEILFFNQAREKPVTLHCVSTAEAHDHPPTLDALFAIHWPCCEVLEVAKGLPLEDSLAQMVPEGARFVGFFDHSRGVREVADRTTELWAKAHQSIHFRASELHSTMTAMKEPDRIAGVFYDQNGIAMAR